MRAVERFTGSEGPAKMETEIAECGKQYYNLVIVLQFELQGVKAVCIQRFAFSFEYT